MGAARAHHHGLALPREIWGDQLVQAKADYAATANAVAAFEPLTMVCADAQDAAEARAALTGDVEVVELRDRRLVAARQRADLRARR